MRWKGFFLLAFLVAFIFLILIAGGELVQAQPRSQISETQLPLASCWLEYEHVNVFPVANGYLIINGNGGSLVYVWKHPSQKLGICDL